MSGTAGLRESLDGELFGPESPGYEAVRRPANARFREVRPRLVVRCRSVSDVVLAIEHARTTGMHIVPRGGGHCFAGRSSTDGMVVDLTGLDSIHVADDGIATIEAGARLAQVYDALHVRGRTIPAGCGATVGLAGLTLGGGIGLLERKHGLTCDRLRGARVVLAEGRVVDCGSDRDPGLFWALWGAGGGQFGVLVSLIFDTVQEPTTARIEGHWSGIAVEHLIVAWQQWAPDAPDEVTANLHVVAEPGHRVRATLFGASLLEEEATRDLLGELSAAAGVSGAIDVRGGLPYYELKSSFEHLDPRDGSRSALRVRSEFFSHSMQPSTVATLPAQLQERTSTAPRQLAFTAMGGAYNRTPETATAFGHRGERFLLEHIAEESDAWVGRPWTTAHVDGSGRVYPNFPQAI